MWVWGSRFESCLVGVVVPSRFRLEVGGWLTGRVARGGLCEAVVGLAARLAAPAALGALHSITLRGLRGCPLGMLCRGWRCLLK